MVRGIDATLFEFAPEDIGAQTEVEDWMLEKARSFGGDRSAAGRYAAEQRWKGHVKADAKGKDGSDPSEEVRKIKTRMKALNTILQRFGVELEIRERLGLVTSPFMRGESKTGLYDPVDIPNGVKKASEEIQRLGTRLLELADQKLVTDGVLSQREVDAAKAEGKAQETAMKISRGALHAILNGQADVTVSVNGVEARFRSTPRLQALASDYREAKKELETLISMSQNPDADYVPDREIREAYQTVRDAAYHFGQEFNDWYFRQTVGKPDMYQNATTESARLVQQSRFRALQELLGTEQFTMSKDEAEADGHLTLKYLPREAAGPMPSHVSVHRFVDSTLSLLPKEAIKTLKDTKVVVQDDKDGFYYYSSKQNMVAVGQEIMSDKAVQRLGPDTRGALGHEIVHAISYADVATRALEQGALSNLRGLRETDGFYGVMPIGTSLVAGGAAFVVDDLMDAYSGRVYQFREYMTRGIPTSVPMSQYEATEMLSTGFEYLIGAGRIRQGYDPYVAGLTAGWMAMMTARAEGAA